MMGGLYCNWLRRGWIREIQGDKESSIKFLSILLPLSTMFATNDSKLTTAALFPITTGHTMLYAGLLNKKARAPTWTEQTLIKWGICLVSNMVVWVLQ